MSKGRGAISRSPSQLEAGLRSGSMLQAMIREGRSFSGHERNCCFLNTGGTRFANVSLASGIDFPDDARAVAAVDWDHDGDLDLWIANRSGPQIRFLRNDLPVDNHFLSIRLVGTSCNRDAIGARLELRLNRQASGKRIKTLRAGDGYLAQSSKWVHFGLGKSTKIEKLVIRWPGGPPEVFTNLNADSRYRIVQGSSRAELLPAEKKTPLLRPSRLGNRLPDEQVRVFSTSRLPLPRLDYKTTEGKIAYVGKGSSRPQLLNLWASWCVPCVKELGEFTRRADELRQAGLEIVALSVDGLSGEKNYDPQAAQKLITKLRFPFTFGYATDGLLEKIWLSNNRLFDRHTPLPVPMSVLIDSSGSLAAIYKGLVQIDQLLEDVKNISANDQFVRQESLPAKGRWLGGPRDFSLIPLYYGLLKLGNTQDVIEYVSRNRDLFPEGFAESTLLAFQGDLALEKGKLEEAEKYYRQALSKDPRLAMAHSNLGLLLMRQGRTSAASRHIRQAITHDPGDAESHLNLGLILAKQGQAEQAISHLREATDLNARDSRAQFVLGTLLARQNNLEEAIQHFQQTIRLDRKSAPALEALANIFYRREEIESALLYFRQAAEALADQERFDKALAILRKVYALALQTNNSALADQIQRQMEGYQKKSAAARKR